MEIKSKKKSPTVILLLLLCALIVIVPLVVNTAANFGGTDDAATDLISEINPEYTPWASSLITIPGEETECLLFCLQAAIGAGTLGFVFGRLVERNSKNKTNKK